MLAAMSPAITAYGNCLRVGDCPADAWMNRAASIDGEAGILDQRDDPAQIGAMAHCRLDRVVGDDARDQVLRWLMSRINSKV